MYCMLFLIAKSGKPTSSPPYLTYLIICQSEMVKTLCGMTAKIASLISDNITIKQMISVV